MLNNLFEKKFAITFVLILIFEILSFLAHQFTVVNIITFVLICSLTAFLSLKKLEYGLYIFLAELFIGSKGHLFFLDIDDERFSIRIGLFSVIFAVWLFNVLRGKSLEFFKTKWLTYYLAIFIFITLGTTNGLLNNGLSNLIFDANGWIYFLMVPVFYAVIKEGRVVNNIFIILLASVFYLCLKTISFLFLFAFKYVEIGEVFYKWLRDSGVAEVTQVTDNFYRIFFQAHFYVMIGFLFTLTLLILKKYSKKDKVPLIIISVLSSLVILISLSRSFWLGIIGGLIMLFILLIVKYKFSIKKIVKTVLVIIIVIVIEIGLLSVIFDGFNSISIGRGAQLKEGPASASRLQQLKPLSTAIFKKPILGSGFGTEVTYVSDDPRIRNQHPDGNYTTYAFEWGYLDIWLKIGLLGLLAYFGLLIKIAKDSLNIGATGVIIFISLTALVVTNTFSPYLNHPLGIGFIMLASAIIFCLIEKNDERAN